jgi:signal transduction histidine kinase
LRDVRADFGVWVGPAAELIVEPSTPEIAFLDARLVKLALHAAMSNAKAFANSSITLGVRAVGRRLVFSVRGDGPGLGTGQTPSGTGLGMTVAAQVAAAHSHGPFKGSTVLRSAEQGGGALFELSLP